MSDLAVNTGRGLRIRPTSRVMVDNDWAGDPDGLVALAHHLLSPSNVVRAVTSSFIDPRFGPAEGTAQRGAALAAELIYLTGMSVLHGVHAGEDTPFREGGRSSAAAQAIAAEAARDDDLPLYLVCGGPLTNVADALRLAPEIASRLTLIWVGGSTTGAEEYNRDVDPAAVAAVFAQPGLPIWQFPLETYRQCAVSVAELQHALTHAGILGEWLWDRFVELPIPDFVAVNEVWPLSDSPPVLLTALTGAVSPYDLDPAHPHLRVYTQVNTRLLLGDLLAKLRLHHT